MSFCVHSFFVLIVLLSLHDVNSFPIAEQSKTVKIVGFSWGNCGADADPLRFNSISVAPDPIRMPGDVNVSISITLTKPFPSDLTAIVQMEKKIVGFYIKVPCVNNVGSCTYRDICTNATHAYPTYLETFGVPRKCPEIPIGTFSATGAIIHISKSLPSEAQGDFRITVNFLSGISGQLGCLHVECTLQ